MALPKLKRKLPPSPDPDTAPPQRKIRHLPPPPAPSALDRMHAGIQYALSRLYEKPRLPPNTERLLVLYRAACEEYVARFNNVEVWFDPSVELRLMAEVVGMEAHGERMGWFRGMGIGKRREAEVLEADLVTLRRMGYYARYRECAPGTLGRWYGREKRLRAGREGWAKVFVDESEMARINRWSEVSAGFFKEEVNWARWQKGGVIRGPDGISTHLAVFTGCSAVGIHWRQMQETIHSYGSQDRCFSERIPDILAQGNVQAIAATLHRDLKDLASVMPLRLEDEELFIRALILELRERWFDRRASEDDPATWRASRDLEQVIEVARNLALVREHATAESNPQFGCDFLEPVKRRHPELVTEQAAKRRLQRVEAEAQDNLVRRLEMRGGPGNRGVLPAQAKSARQRVWQNIIQQQARASSDAQLSLESQRERDQVLLLIQAGR